MVNDEAEPIFIASGQEGGLDRLFLGIGELPLIYSAVVLFPDSTSMYPVDIGSILLFFTSGAAITWVPMRCSAFLPLTKEIKRIASALEDI